MKRAFDITAALFFCILLIIPLLAVALLVKLTSRGPVLYWSDRVGMNNRIFQMPKFRTMLDGAPEIATHLMKDSAMYLTPLGVLLRKTSLDELPQLWSIVKGDMSFVGPRPALFNQDDLVELRTLKGIHKLVPGVTGWAQINGRDEISMPAKVAHDEYYLKNKSFLLDLKILLISVVKVLKADGVSH